MGNTGLICLLLSGRESVVGSRTTRPGSTESNADMDLSGSHPGPQLVMQFGFDELISPQTLAASSSPTTTSPLYE